MARLLVFGLGYTARALVRRLGPEWSVTGTTHDGRDGSIRFDRDHSLPDEIFADVTHVLVSIPPDEQGDPVYDIHGADLAHAHLQGKLSWVGYLSTTGVYGTREGGWVDETSELRPTGSRGERRVGAETAWLHLQRQHGVPVHVFRLAGIYGPGRSALDALRDGSARRIDAGDQVFSRIHVDDIASVLLASIAQPQPGAIYNVCDDEPAAQAEIVAHAARLLGVEPPSIVPLAEADLSPMARSFYADNKRVSNALIKQELGVILSYPNYRVGLSAIIAAGG